MILAGFRIISCSTIKEQEMIGGKGRAGYARLVRVVFRRHYVIQ